MTAKQGIVLLKVNINKWNSPVCKQFSINSVPYLMIYDKNGNLTAQGQEARQIINNMIKSK
jgi:hypothetical protein